MSRKLPTVLTAPAPTRHPPPRTARFRRKPRIYEPFARPLLARRIPLSGLVRDKSPVRHVTGFAPPPGCECDADPYPPTVR
ncbi:hypothetical protein GPN2_23440 [Streptomyces murinus]